MVSGKALYYTRPWHPPTAPSLAAWPALCGLRRSRHCRGLILLSILLCCLAGMAQSAERSRYDRTAPADKAFVDTVLDLEQAIGAHNFAITARNDIGAAIRQRGHDRFGDATIVHFCNLEYARRVLAIDPGFLLYMPCRIAVFEQDRRIHVASWLLPVDTERPAFNTLAVEINGHIRDVIDAAVAPITAPVAPARD